MTFATGVRFTMAGVTMMMLCAAAHEARAQTPVAPAGETVEQRDARMAWWREARFGLFIHWGLYAVPAGVWKGRDYETTAGEWLMYGAQIPVAEYEPLVSQFNPVHFNAEAWVRLAKEAGMKYIVITTKHHDGFALFDSQVSEYDIMATPFKRDVMKELAEECRKQGLRIGWYHSILDWHHPDYLPRGEGSPRPWDTRPTEGADFNRYIDYMKAQLTELLTNYGDIGVLWFDGGWEHSADELRSAEVVELARRLQPHIIINNRIMLPQDFDTPEQSIPSTGMPERDWETCMTMNDTWGYKVNDQHWKSPETLIRNLVDIAGKGGNYLLNVGPTAEGLIPAPSVERLEAIGRWMAVNGESIYGTGPSPFRSLKWGRCTTKLDKLYLHVFSWPEKGALVVPGLSNVVKKCYLLSDSQQHALAVTQAENEVLIVLPETAPDPVDTVVVLDIEGKPEIVPLAAKQSATGDIELEAAQVTIHGESPRYESGDGKDNIGFWTNPEDWLSWEMRVTRPGTFLVSVTYACESGQEGSEYVVSIGEQEINAKVSSTGQWNDFKTDEIGSLRIPSAGTCTLVVKPKSMPGSAVMNLRGITLRLSDD